jgi:hypothetical protein
MIHVDPLGHGHSHYDLPAANYEITSDRLYEASLISNRRHKDHSYCSHYLPSSPQGQSTEFYFFHHRILPPFIYTLWMADLAVLYAGSSGPTAIRTQRAFLKPYEECYPQMIRFFEGLQTIAAEETEVLNRNSRIAAYVQGWVRDNARNI